MIYVIKEKDMEDWKNICAKFCEKFGWRLLFVNQYGFGAETKDEKLIHMSVEEMYDTLNLKERLEVDTDVEEI